MRQRRGQKPDSPAAPAAQEEAAVRLGKAAAARGPLEAAAAAALPVLLPVGAALLAFGGARLGTGFVLDDDLVVPQNPAVNGRAPSSAVWSTDPRSSSSRDQVTTRKFKWDRASAAFRHGSVLRWMGLR